MIEFAPQAPREVDDDLPVMARFASRRYGRLDTRDAALGIGHRAVLFAPAGGRQQQVGVGGCIGIGKALLEHDEFGIGQSGTNRRLMRQGLCRIGAGDPDRLDLAAGQSLEQVDGRLAGLCRNFRDSPQGRHLGAVLRIRQVSVRRQQIGQPADLATAHGIRLPGQGEGTGTGLADLAASQMQLDQRSIVVRTVRRLVEPLAVKRQRRSPGGKPARRAHDIAGRNTAQFGDPHRGVFGNDGGLFGKSVGMFGNIGLVDQSLADHHMQHAVEQRDVAARLDRQMEIGDGGAFGAARIDDDDFQVRIGRPRVLDAAKDDGMGNGRIGAGDQDDPGLGNIVVTTRRRIGTQRLLVAGHGR